MKAFDAAGNLVAIFNGPAIHSPPTQKPHRDPPMLLRLCEAQNWRCAYCSIVMWGDCYTGRKDDPRHSRATKDHLVPRGRGGGHDFHNLIAACQLCNSGRDCIDPMLYFDLVQRYGRNRAPREARQLPEFYDMQRAPAHHRPRPNGGAASPRGQRHLVGHDTRFGGFNWPRQAEPFNSFEAQLEAALLKANGGD